MVISLQRHRDCQSWCAYHCAAYPCHQIALRSAAVRWGSGLSVAGRSRSLLCKEHIRDEISQNEKNSENAENTSSK